MGTTDIRTLASPAAVRSHAAAHPHAQGAAAHDYSRNPMNVYWEMTQACGLACRHCRAEAVSTPDPGELNHEESRQLLHQIASFGAPLPHLILTGGDPLRRADLYDLIDEAKALGLTVSITPSATEDLTFNVFAKLKAHGIDSIGLSLDGATPERHEAVRGVAGCFEWTRQAILSSAKLSLPVQVNTLVARETVDDLPAIYEFLKSVTIMRWSLFFLIAVGRGAMLQPISPQEGETIMQWIFERAQASPFIVATTEAPSYRRVALQHMRQAGWTAAQIEKNPVYRGFGIRDGHGIMFISNQGDVRPAGFLPLTVGNVRTESPVEIYRHSPIFRDLHTPTLFRGKCGNCEYTTLCGGSRARAFAATGDPLSSDPFCPYEPRKGAQA